MCDNILIMQNSIILGVLIMLEAAAVIAAIVLQGTIVSVASHHITSHHIWVVHVLYIIVTGIACDTTDRAGNYELCDSFRW